MMAISLRKTFIYALVVAGVLMGIPEAHAELTGMAELSYTMYDSKDTEQEVKASALQQRYSLLYKTSGVLLDNRLGRYKVALGYEWAGLDTNIKQLKEGSSKPNHDDATLRSGHLLYEGEIVIDPKELPFRFRAYSRDLREATFQNDMSDLLSGGNPLVVPTLPTSINGGVHILTGATLTLGVKNGMTNGFNTVFKDLPMVLVDYRDEIHKDLESQTPTDSRLKKLAFVSLNKKDNWFHFRTTRYTDNINKDSSYEETQVQIGTVDQFLVRRWIDLTNWIKISVDGQFTKRNDYSTNGEEQLYEVNLFGIASRRMWEAKMYNYFSRKVDSAGLLYQRRLPLYLKGNVGIDTEWNLRTSYEDWQRVGAQNEDRTTMLASLRVDTFKRSPFTLSNKLEVERYKAAGTNYVSVSDSIETSSTRRFSDKVSFFASYDIRKFVNDTFEEKPHPTIPGLTVTEPTQEGYLSQTLRARGIYRPENRLKTEIELLADRTDGNPAAAFAQKTKVKNSNLSNFSHTVTNEAFSRYVVTSRTDWEPLARLKLSLTASEDVLIVEDEPTDYLTIAGISADYSISKLYARAEMKYTMRSGGPDGTGTMLEQSARIHYTHDKTLDAGLTYRFNRVSEEGEEAREEVNLSQTFNYYFYSSRGMSRKLLEVNQIGEYTKSSTETRKTLSVGLRYNATQQLFLSARTKYSFLNRGGSSDRDAVYTATAGMNFQKLQVALDYSYGRRDGDDKRVDKRFSMNVRKIF